jgi:hypothetical protein
MNRRLESDFQAFRVSHPDFFIDATTRASAEEGLGRVERSSVSLSF